MAKASPALITLRTRERARHPRLVSHARETRPRRSFRHDRSQGIAERALIEVEERREHDHAKASSRQSVRRTPNAVRGAVIVPDFGGVVLGWDSHGLAGSTVLVTTSQNALVHRDSKRMAPIRRADIAS